MKVVPWAKLDILALMNLTSSWDPPDIPVQAKKEEAVYLVGDASTTGMGSVFWVQGGEVIDAEFGTWREVVTEGKSLNFREAANLVQRIKKLMKDGKIQRGLEVFIITDNLVAEKNILQRQFQITQITRHDCRVTKARNGRVVNCTLYLDLRKMHDQARNRRSIPRGFKLGCLELG